MKDIRWKLAALAAAAIVAACGGETADGPSNKVGINAMVSFGDSLSDIGSYNVGSIAGLGQATGGAGRARAGGGTCGGSGRCNSRVASSAWAWASLDCVRASIATWALLCTIRLICSSEAIVSAITAIKEFASAGKYSRMNSGFFSAKCVNKPGSWWV